MELETLFIQTVIVWISMILGFAFGRSGKGEK